MEQQGWCGAAGGGGGAAEGLGGVESERDHRLTAAAG